MLHEFNLIEKDITKIDFDGMFSAWEWKLANANLHAVEKVTVWGDIFFSNKDGNIYLLKTDDGNFTKIASNYEEFRELLRDENNTDNWFMPLLLERLYNSGKMLKEDEVFSFIKMPVLGGDYSIENIVPCSLSVHLEMAGQICEQIKDLPDGTKVKVVIGKKSD